MGILPPARPHLMLRCRQGAAMGGGTRRHGHGCAIIDNDADSDDDDDDGYDDLAEQNEQKLFCLRFV